MKRSVQISIGVVIVLAVLAGAVLFLLGSLDAIVKAAIEEHGSHVTQTRVGVGSVKITLADGKGSISGITVANPSGYSQPDAFRLGAISTSIDTATVTKDPVVIKEIVISGPEIFYEINKQGSSNFDALKKNVAAATGGGKSADGGKEVKLVINRLVVEGGKVSAKIAALDKDLNTSLPRIVLTDIGRKQGGATGAEVAQQVIEAVLSKTTTAVSQLGVQQYLGKSQEELMRQLEAVKDPAKGLGETLKQVPGGDGLQKLFQ